MNAALLLIALSLAGARGLQQSTPPATGVRADVQVSCGPEAAALHGSARDYHRLQQLLYACLQQGRYRKVDEILSVIRRHAEAEDAEGGAAAGAHGARDHLIGMSARAALERGRWDEAMALPHDGTARHAEGTLWFARGVGAARAARPDGDPAAMPRAWEAAERLERLAARDGRRSRSEVERLGVLAAIAAAQEEREEMGLLLDQAARLEEALATPEPSAVPVIPIHELAGELWLQVHRFADAAREFRAALARHPKRARSIYGLARASSRAGDPATARQAYTELLELWRHADPDRPELQEARDYLARGSEATRR